jgi:Uncharacterized alpha/beta hydrolase domain (DUF2235)
VERNIVVCSDGTGSTFDRKVTNATSLVGCILADASRQLVLYDQGIGTTAARTSEIDRLRQSAADPEALRILAAPAGGKPLSWVTKGRAQATGYGLRENVGQMYLALAGCYQRQRDRVAYKEGRSGVHTGRTAIQACGRAQVDRSRRIVRWYVSAVDVNPDGAVGVLDRERSVYRPACPARLDVAGLEGDRRPPVGDEEPRSAQVAVAPPVAGVNTASVQLGADADGPTAQADRHAGVDEGNLAGDGAQPNSVP